MGEKILNNHKRERKKLISPYNYQLDSLKELSWVDNRLPELLWIAIIQEQKGKDEGIELISEFSKQCLNISERKKISFFGITSSFNVLTQKEKKRLMAALKEEILEELKILLKPFILWYPECPLNFLFYSNELSVNEKDKEFLEFLKDVVADLFDRFSFKATMLQATFIKFGFDSGKLFVKKGLSLSNFSEINNYPSTEESRKVAASIRASSSALIGLQLDEIGYAWPDYFWDRGLEVDNCYFNKGG